MDFVKQTADVLVRVSLDEGKIRREEDRWAKRFLSRFGAFVRRAVRSSMRRRPRGKYSTPPKPPFAHDNLYRDSILFEVARPARSVAIGPRDYAAEFAELHEFGGVKLGGRRGERVYPARPHIGPGFEKGMEDMKRKASDPLPRMWHNAV